MPVSHTHDAPLLSCAPKPSSKRRFLRRLGFSVGGLFLLISFFYAEEDLRGWLAWENCKHELAAKGEVLDWNAYIPPPVPDDLNFFKAPKMTDWFVRNNGKSNTNDLTERLRNPDTTATNLNETAAAKYLAWTDQFEPDFDSIREALKRPYARMDGDYSKPYQISRQQILFPSLRLCGSISFAEWFS